MSMRYPGGLIASSPVNAAYPSGVWTQAQTQPYAAQNVWMRDQFWPNTTLLLQGNGTNGAQNNTFLDSSTNNFTITRNGNTTQGSFTPYEANGYWSNFFDGTGDQLSIANNAAFDVGSGDFTIEAWVYLTGTTGSVINYSNGQTQNSNFAWEILQNSATSIQVSIASSNTVYIASSTALVANAWNHVAGVRNGNTLTVYVNGVAGGTTATVTGVTVNNPSGATVKVSGYNNSTAMITGYVSNARLVKGTAVYTANFTPSTTPLTAITNTSLLTCQSNRFIDNSTNAFTLTRNGDTSVQAFQPFPGATTWSGSVLGGSGYFDGSGDSLTLPSSSSLAMGTNNFTIEFWFYTSNVAQGGYILDTNPSAPSASLYISFSSSTLRLTDQSTVYAATPTLVNNAWHHIAIVRSGTGANQTVIYTNGVAGTAGTCSQSFTQNAPAIGSSSFLGYIANLRILNGTAQYTTNFTPPTAPLTAITNTQLLLNFTNAGIFDSAMMNNLETVGNAQVSTSVVKYGTGSMAFDGSGDYLAIPSTQNLAFGTGDFTVECWAYWSAIASTGKGIVDLQSTGSFNFYWDGGTYSANQLVVSNRSSNQISYSFLPTAGVWYHLAVSRSGNTMRLFINGVLATSVTDTTNYGAGVASIGGDAGNGSAWSWNGYIDDLRITKGAARYITNFTPPPARLPAQ